MRRALLLASLPLLLSAPAQAAFRYSGGASTGFYVASPPPLTVDNGAPTPTAPQQDAAPAMPADMPTTYVGGEAPAVEVAPTEAAAPAAAIPAPAAPQPEMSPASAATGPYLGNQADAGETREGFGDDVPLIVALQGILPQGYGFAYGQGVSMGQRVTWAGAKPWRILLTDVLAGLRLYGTEADRFVYVEKAQ